MSSTQQNSAPQLIKTTIDGATNSELKRGKRKKQLTSTPKNKRPKSQPPLLDFLVNHEVQTIIKNPKDYLSSGLMPNSESANHIFLLMLGTKTKMECVQPILMKTFDSILDPKEFMRCRIDNSSYVGRIISQSKNLNALEETVESVVKKYSVGWKANMIKKEFLILACTKPIKLMEVPLDDERVIFLKTIIQNDSDILNSDSCQQVNQQMKSNSDLFFDESQDNAEMNARQSEPDDEEEVDSLNSKATNEASIQPSKIQNEGFITKLSNHDSGNFFEVSSGSEDEFDSTQKEKKVRRKRIHTDSKLVAKFREEKKQQAAEANVEIVSLASALNEIIPTLPSDNPFTPVVRKIYRYCQALNAKFNNLNEKAVLENAIPITRTIKLLKSSNTDQIDLIGVMKFPIKEYSWAIQADEPRLVMSRIMRGCIPDSYKDECIVNNQSDNSNFLFRIGDEALKGQQRLDNGKEKIELLIEHSHSVKALETMTFQSYRDCKAQVDRALYDFARNKQKRIGISNDEKPQQRNEKQIAEQETIKYFFK